MHKLLYIDTETTGLDPKANDIITLSGIIEYDDNSIEPILFDYKMKPTNMDNINQQALDVNGYTVEQLNELQPASVVMSQFVEMLDKYIDKYDKQDKFTVIGYNVRFDIDFIFNTCKKTNFNYFGSYINGHSLDVYEICKYFNMIYKWNLSTITLYEICKYFSIEYDAHISTSDILATRTLYYSLRNLMSSRV